MRKFCLVSGVFLAFALGQTELHADVVLSENFDELTQGLAVTSVGAFTAINGTNVDIIGAGGFALCNGPESGNCVDLNGSNGNPQGQLQSNMTFAPGNYLLSFDLVGSQRGTTGSVTVTFGDYDQTFTLASGDLTDGEVVNAPVTLTTAGQLLFTSDVTGNIGLVLDNVVVSTPGTAAAPEPASVLLAGAGIFASAFAFRRRSAGGRQG